MEIDARHEGRQGHLINQLDDFGKEGTCYLQITKSIKCNYRRGRAYAAATRLIGRPT